MVQRTHCFIGLPSCNTIVLRTRSFLYNSYSLVYILVHRTNTAREIVILLAITFKCSVISWKLAAACRPLVLDWEFIFSWSLKVFIIKLKPLFPKTSAALTHLCHSLAITIQLLVTYVTWEAQWSVAPQLKPPYHLPTISPPIGTIWWRSSGVAVSSRNLRALVNW